MVDPALKDLQDLAHRFDEEQVSATDAKWMAQRAYASGWSKGGTMEAAREGRAQQRGDDPRKR